MADPVQNGTPAPDRDEARIMLHFPITMADSTMAPEWRQCKRFPDYEVSSTGLVRKGGSLRKLQIHPWGYTLVCITAKPKQLKVYVHRLVAEAFLGDGPPGYEVDHINNDKTDNRLVNLRWLSRSENRRLRQQRNTGPTARELQEAGKASSATLHVDGRLVHGERVGKWRNLRKGKTMACGQIVSTAKVAVEDIVRQHHLSNLHLVSTTEVIPSSALAIIPNARATT